MFESIKIFVFRNPPSLPAKDSSKEDRKKKEKERKQKEKEAKLEREREQKERKKLEKEKEKKINEMKKRFGVRLELSYGKILFYVF